MSLLRPAELLLQELGVTQPDEINLEAIAFYAGASVRYRSLEGCEAHIIGSHAQAIITVDRHSGARRKRFSIAHELGHWHHHRGQRLVCRVEGFQARGQLAPERIANSYAADLLMPNYLFGAAAKRFTKLDFKTVAALATEFDVSHSAAAIRLVEAGHAPALLLCHGAHGRKWFVAGPGIPERWFPRPDLDPESPAFGVLFGRGANDPMPRKIGAEAWFDRAEASRFELKEQSIRTGDDEIITLLLIIDGEMLEERNTAQRIEKNRFR